MRRTRFDDAECPIARVTDLFGDWWTPLVLRDAMYGITKFEDFQHELGVSRAVLSARLTRLVDEGLMEKVPYQARPVRHEYVLTEKGRAAWSVLAAMWRFGEDHLWDGDETPPVELAFRDTAEPVRPTVVDESTGRPVTLDQITIRTRR
jgi:DNA-binding HxlR family transcriptional regulator